MAKFIPKKLSAKEAEELVLCSPSKGLAGFIRFCEKHVKIEDKRTGMEIPFFLWDCQRDLAEILVSGEWVIILKARQLGITWLVSVFVLWKMVYERFYKAIVINQDKKYAEDFCSNKVKFVYDRLPDMFRMEVSKDTLTELNIGSGGKGHFAELLAIASSAKAARSYSAKCLVYDEAAYHEDFGKALSAGEPTLKNTGGQSVVLSTSNGPHGGFYKKCKLAMAGQGAYRFVFFSWDAHPDRDTDWYETERINHLDDPLYMPREYPGNPEDAFESAGGRIFPFFSRLSVPKGHSLHIPTDSFLPEWPRYRMIDWGEKRSAFVCLWAVAMPTKKPRLTYDPSLIHFPEEMTGYAYKPDSARDEPKKEGDHCPDAFRYGVVTFDLTDCHVHVYREFWVQDAVGKGYTAQRLCSEIKKMSGWELVDPSRNLWKAEKWVEEYAGTVFDRARPMVENEFFDLKMDAIPHEVPIEAKGRESEVSTGIAMVNNLILGGIPKQGTQIKTPEDIQDELDGQIGMMASLGIRTATPLLEKIRKFAVKKQGRSRNTFRRRFR